MTQRHLGPRLAPILIALAIDGIPVAVSFQVSKLARDRHSPLAERTSQRS